MAAEPGGLLVRGSDPDREHGTDAPSSTDPVPPLEIRVLGGFSARRGDTDVPLEPRAAAVLVHLLAHRHGPLPRERLASAMWPDSGDAQARTNLRHVLHNLRRSLPEMDRYVTVTPSALQWRPDAPAWVDVVAFERGLTEADDSGSPAAALSAAVDLYGGDLLAGHDGGEWLQEERGRLRRRYVGALETLASRLEQEGEVPAAVRYAERLLREDPLREGTYRMLMRLHDVRGDRARAVRVYHECVATLERELGIDPAPATRAAYDVLLPDDGERPPAMRRLAGTPYVGRSPERAALAAVFRAATGESTRLVMLTGEAGVGKTRLAEEFAAWCTRHGAATATARAYPADGAPAYAPLVEWLRAPALAPGVRALDTRRLTDLARLLPELLVDVNAVLPTGLDDQSESRQRQRLYDAVAQVLRGQHARLVLVADDVQWWDHETLELLHHLLRRGTGAPLLVAATARPEELEGNAALRDLLTDLRVQDLLTEIELDRLSVDQTGVLAGRLVPGELDVRSVEELYRQTEGNPLFVVEAVRAGWPARADVVTAKVQAVIESRLARLSEPARELVGLAAVVGADFTTGLLVAAGTVEEHVVVRALDELWRRRIVREVSAAAYDFSHDTIREVAYRAIGPALRRHLHGRVGRALEHTATGNLDPVAGRLARHLEHAGDTSRAVEWYARAADVAQRVYAHDEAARLLSRALELVQGLPAGDGRTAAQLRLLTALPAVLLAIEGYGSARLGELHDRALELCRTAGADPEPPLLRSLAIAGLARGDFAGADRLGRRLRERGERDDDDVLRVEGDYVRGVCAFWDGRFDAARAHLESAVATYRDERRQVHMLRYGQDPKVVCLLRLACTYWFLGDAARAVAAREEGLRLADRIAHPYSTATALVFASLLALEMGDTDALREHVGRASAVVPGDGPRQTRVALAAYEAYLTVLDGVAIDGRATDGRATDGLRQLQRLVDDSAGLPQAAPGLHSALVRILLAACEAADDARTGLAAAEQMLAITSSAVWRPLAARLRSRFAADLEARGDRNARGTPVG